MDSTPDPLREYQQREASLEDADKIAAVHKVSCLEVYPNPRLHIERADIEAANLDSEDRVQQWRARIENESGNEKIWVVEDDGQVIGFCYVIKREGKNEIYSIYLNPEYTRRGIGRKLMSTASEWVGTDKDLMLEVVPYNKVAIGFYESLGFKKTERRTEFTFNVDKPGKVIPLVEMVRSRVQRVMDQ